MIVVRLRAKSSRLEPDDIYISAMNVNGLASCDSRPRTSRLLITACCRAARCQPFRATCPGDDDGHSLFVLLLLLLLLLIHS